VFRVLLGREPVNETAWVINSLGHEGRDNSTYISFISNCDGSDAEVELHQSRAVATL
jgi:hypothetical protein